MYYPLVYERVRVRGREDEYTIVSVDHAAYVADICVLADTTAIDKNVPFNLLSASCEFEATEPDLNKRESRSAAVRDILHSSHARIYQGHAMIVDLRNSILTTLHAVRTSQQLIQDSDRAIARARNLDGNGVKKR